MNTTTTPTPFENETEDYKRGFRDGVKYMQDMEDEAAILEVIFGSKTREDLSERQLRRMESGKRE